MNKSFKTWFEEAEEVDLSHILAPAGQVYGMGQEKTVMFNSNGICKYVSPHGSYRYVYMLDNKPISGLQVVSKDKKIAIISQVFTKKEYRRMGYAKLLLSKVKMDFKHVIPATHLSDDGQAWTQKMF